MNATSIIIDECEDTECQKCHETAPETVSICVTLDTGESLIVFLCQGCIADAVGAAVDDGLATEMILPK